VRLAALLHDAGKPASAWRGSDGRLHFYANAELGKRSHEEIGAELTGDALSRLRYPGRLRAQVVRLVREHMFGVSKPESGARARRFLHRHGDEPALDLVAHKRADLLGKRTGQDAAVTRELDRLEAFRRTLERELDRPHRLDQLAVGGNDLIELGFRPGPALGTALDHLLSCVIGDPALNTREWLLAEAGRELQR
jgi:hypothetical protein